MMNKLLLFMCIFIIGCGWYIDDYKISTMDYTDICENSCSSVCERCYSSVFSINRCVSDCNIDCKAKSCYLDSYWNDDCNKMFQELCNGQYN